MGIFLVKSGVWNAMSNLAREAIVKAGYKNEFIEEETQKDTWAKLHKWVK